MNIIIPRNGVRFFQQAGLESQDGDSTLKWVVNLSRGFAADQLGAIFDESFVLKAWHLPPAWVAPSGDVAPPVGVTFLCLPKEK